MIKTVQISNHQLVQGEFLNELGNGQICVEVYGRVHVGRPVNLYMRAVESVVADPGQWGKAGRAG